MISQIHQSKKCLLAAGKRWDRRSHRWNHISWRATNQRGSCKAIIWTSLDDHDDHHLDIIPWHLIFTFGDNECELCTKGSFFNHRMITGKYLCGVKQCVYRLEWLIAMGGCWKWWDCHRINYKSPEELVKGGFHNFIFQFQSLSYIVTIIYFSEWQTRQDVWLFWITIVCHCAEKWSNLLIFQMINLSPICWFDSLSHKQL